MHGTATWTSFTSGPHSGVRRLAVPKMGEHIPANEQAKVLELIERRQPFLAFDLACELEFEYGRTPRQQYAEAAIAILISAAPSSDKDDDAEAA